MIKISREFSKFSEPEVKKLFRKATCVLRHPGLVLLCAKATDDFGKILIVTSRKIGNAAKRNLIRRRIKALFYENKLYEKQLDCIVIVKKEGINLSFDELKTILVGHVK